MSDPLFDAFWARYASSAPAGAPHEPSRALAHSRAVLAALPMDFVRWLSARSALRIDHPRLRVSGTDLARCSGDWLGLALERHHAMRALADEHDNPLLARMVPFADGGHGLELALRFTTSRDGESAIVALDPSRYDAGPAAIRAILAPDATRFVRDLLDSDPLTAPPFAHAPSIVHS
jgi:hypothetical protein